MIFFLRLLLCIFLIKASLSDEPWILPRSASFHHAFELIQARLKTSDLSSSLTFSSLVSFSNNDTACQKDLLLLMNGSANHEKWAWKILDSWGTKPPAGILEGSHLWLGSYDECVHPLYLPNNRSHLQQPYPTKYCTVSSGNQDDDQILVQKPTLVIGICLPQSCHSDDFPTNSIAIRCRSDERHLSRGTTVTLSLIISLTFFVCLTSFIPSLRDYSAVSTLKKIFSSNNHPSTYPFLNGIRTISLFWIILGHSYVFQMTMSDNIVHLLDNLQHSFLNQLIFGAVFSVDTFFFISGFLAVFIFLNTFKTQENFHVRHLLLYYFHRYCRLIPTLVFILLVSLHLTPWLGNGPIYPTSTGFEVSTCRHQWWTTILFLNNIISPTESCLPVTWYIANDFQYHLMAPILLIPFLYNRRRLTYLLLSIILLINIVATMSIISTHPGTETGLSGDGTVSIEYFEKVYITPWCRIGAFVIGMITKLILEDSNARLSRRTIIICTMMSTIISMICIFFPFYAIHFPRIGHILYQSLSRQCWAMVIGWLIFSCSTNHGGVVNRILSCSFWSIPARLSYSAYLLHAIIILVQVYNRLSTIHYQSSIVLNNFIAQVLITLLASVVVVVLVETPCQVLEKRIRKYCKEKQQSLTVRQSYETID